MDDKFGLLADCIHTGQVSQEDVQRIMYENPEFATWYVDQVNMARQYCTNMEIEKCQVNPQSKLA